MHSLRRRPARRHVFALAAVATALGAAAAMAATPSKSVTNYLAYVGGKAGKANPKLSPIKIGYVNQEGGAIVIGKTNDNGVQAAVKYINTYAGGIGGHPPPPLTCLPPPSQEE